MGPALLVSLSLGLARLVPPCSDLEHLPGEETCAEQVRRYEDAVARVRQACLVRGYGDARTDAWLDQARGHLAYWRLLDSAYEAWGHGDDWTRGRLWLLRAHAGWGPYYSGWHPPLFPDPEQQPPGPD